MIMGVTSYVVVSFFPAFVAAGETIPESLPPWQGGHHGSGFCRRPPGFSSALCGPPRFEMNRFQFFNTCLSARCIAGRSSLPEPDPEDTEQWGEEGDQGDDHHH